VPHPGSAVACLAAGRAVPRREAAMPGRRPLTSDRAAEIALDAEAGNLAIALSKGQVSEEQAVGRLALIAPGRPDLVDAAAGGLAVG
jgi:hypothetical protein